MEGGVLFSHLLEIEFLRVSWVLIHFLPNLPKYARKGVISCHHHFTGSKESWFNFPQNKLNWVGASLHESLSILTCDIQSENAVEGFASLACGLNSLRVKYSNLWHPTRECRRGFCIPSMWFNFSKGKILQPTMDLGKVPINIALNWNGPNLNFLRLHVVSTHSGNLPSCFLYKPTHCCEVGGAPC